MNKVKIIVYESSNRFINYLIYNKIYYDELICFDSYYSLNVYYDDYIRISRRYKTKVVKNYGFYGIINFLKYNKYMIISFLFSMLFLFLLSDTIFEIRINTDDNDIKNRIVSSLNNYGISKYKHKKSFNELSIIKDNILKDNEDLLEWIEINEKGCIYEINLTKRVKENVEQNSGISSIYSSKDGVIKKIIVYNGTKIKDINDYVHKGDVLISGNIYKNDMVDSQVKADGIVYAEVWYSSRVNVPFNYYKYEYTGKMIKHYYLDFFGYKFTLFGKYDSKDVLSEKKLILSKPFLPFKLYREIKKEYKNKKIVLDYNEAYNLAISESEKSINNNLSSDEYIISKKVLKKEVKSSKIYLEVFFKVYENIGVTSNVDLIGDKNGKSN